MKIHMRKALNGTVIEDKNISYSEYCNIVDFEAIHFFTSLGGSETMTFTKTPAGVQASKLVSVSPNGKDKCVYEFDFIR